MQISGNKMAALFAKLFVTGEKGTGDTEARLKKILDDLKSAFKMPESSTDIGKEDKQLGRYQLPVTHLERMGFVFRGGPYGIEDPAKKTAQHTLRTAIAVEAMSNYFQSLPTATESGIAP
jgi:hypothetical protein